MGKQEEIFLGTCIHIAKDDMIARGIPIINKEDELLVAAERIYKAAMQRKFLDLPRIDFNGQSR